MYCEFFLSMRVHHQHHVSPILFIINISSPQEHSVPKWESLLTSCIPSPIDVHNHFRNRVAMTIWEKCGKRE